MKKYLWRGYQAALSVSALAAGLCLMAKCLSLYRSGSFTPEKVAEAFGPIAPVIFLFLALALAGLALQPLLPKDKITPEKNYPLILHRLQSTTDPSACPAALQKQLLTLHRRRGYVWAAQWVLLLVCAGLTLRYATDWDNFHLEHINSSMVQAMTFMLPCMALPFAFGIFAAWFRRSSIRQEIALLKTAPAEAKRPAPVDLAKEAGSRQWVSCGVLVCAAALLICGFFLGGWQDVLTKAVNICTECVGLG